MAVDQARHLNFFREMLSSGNSSNINQIQIGNKLYSNGNITSSLGIAGATMLPATANESLLPPFYNLNEVVLQSGAGKLSPAVKDDSGVTFNNSFVPPVAPVSRKRTRDPPVLTTPMISGGILPSLLTVNPITSANSVVRKESGGFSFLGEDLSLQIMQQQLEHDQLITQHMENMRMELENRKKQHLRRTVVAIEEAMAKKLRDKEEEIDKISKINFALEEKVKSLCIENQIWRDLAQTNEATANALRTNLEQVLQQVRENLERPSGAPAVAGDELTDDAVSCCGSSGYGGENDEDNEQRLPKLEKNDVVGGKGWIYRGKNEGNSYLSEKSSQRLCRKCGEGESRVLLLPCRHLCLCTTCGPTVNCCPICNSPKNASVHVNLS